MLRAPKTYKNTRADATGPCPTCAPRNAILFLHKTYGNESTYASNLALRLPAGKTRHSQFEDNFKDDPVGHVTMGKLCWRLHQQVFVRQYSPTVIFVQ
jgi:hypothetical protein